MMRKRTTLSSVAMLARTALIVAAAVSGEPALAEIDADAARLRAVVTDIDLGASGGGSGPQARPGRTGTARLRRRRLVRLRSA